MESVFIHNIVKTSILLVISLCIISWAIYHYIKSKRMSWFPCLMGVLALIIMGMGIRILCNNVRYYDLWEKIYRTPQMQYIQDIVLTKEECVDDFKEIMKIVEANYQEVARHKNIDLKKLHVDYQAKVAVVEDAEEYASLLLKYFSSLQNMHTNLYFQRYKSHIPLVTRNDSVWISQSRENLNLKRKDLILSIDGVPTADVIRQSMDIIPASIDAVRRKYAALNVLNSYTDTCKIITIQRNDSIFSLKIPLYKKLAFVSDSKEEKMTFDKTLPAVTAMLKEELNIGYIPIPDFSLGSVKCFTQFLDSLRECPHLILDVRNNPGGKALHVIYVAKKLIDKEKTIDNLTIVRDSLYYKGKIYILMNEMSASAAEYLVAVLKGQHNVVVIGQRSGGDCGSSAYNFRTSHGIEFRLATQPAFLLPDGITYSEGEGIMPDIEVRELLPWEEGSSTLLKAIELIVVERKNKS